MIPVEKLEPERYQGRPLLVVLENYVLDCIGQLEPEKQRLASAVVQRVFGGGEDWKATVRAKLELGEGLDQHLRELWARNQKVARDAAQDLQPVQFAKMIVDENFASLIGPPLKAKRKPWWKLW